MVSKKQLVANKNNARKSTGPKSSVGIDQAKKNSIKHGLLSKDLIIRDEDPKKLNTLIEELILSLQPEGKMEEILVEKIASTLWRLQRLISAEAGARNENDWMGKLEAIHKAYNSSTIASISRYESTLERALYKALHELQRIQGLRLGQAVLAPIAIDLHTDS